jgi:hypothetical protein
VNFLGASILYCSEFARCTRTCRFPRTFNRRLQRISQRARRVAIDRTARFAGLPLSIENSLARISCNGRGARTGRNLFRPDYVGEQLDPRGHCIQTIAPQVAAESSPACRRSPNGPIAWCGLAGDLCPQGCAGVAWGCTTRTRGSARVKRRRVDCVGLWSILTASTRLQQVHRQPKESAGCI